jgi:hypothetical protein
MEAGAAPKKSSTGVKVLALGCLGCVGLCVIFAVIGMVIEMLKSPEQRAAERKEREDASSAAHQKTLDTARGLSATFASVARQLPAPDALQELENPAFKGKSIEVTPADAGFFAQFDDVGYVSTRDCPTVWFRSSKLDDAKEVLAKIAKKEDFFDFSVSSADAEVRAKPYFGVFYPVLEKLPKTTSDGKFESGFFDGWIVVVELSTGKPVRIARFQARSSDSVESHSLKVAGVKVAGGIDSAIQEDFRTNFMLAALTAVQK